MGEIILSRRFSPTKTDGLLKPIIYCGKFPEIEMEAVSLNKLLAEALIEINPKRRAMKIENCFTDVLAMLPVGVIIKDFDVLFNPEYKVDVLKILVNACKTKPFSVLWPGAVQDNKLIYAEESYPDYKEFEIEMYDITCVV